MSVALALEIGDLSGAETHHLSFAIQTLPCPNFVCRGICNYLSDSQPTHAMTAQVRHITACCGGFGESGSAVHMVRACAKPLRKFLIYIKVYNRPWDQTDAQGSTGTSVDSRPSLSGASVTLPALVAWSLKRAQYTFR